MVLCVCCLEGWEEAARRDLGEGRERAAERLVLNWLIVRRVSGRGVREASGPRAWAGRRGRSGQSNLDVVIARRWRMELVSRAKAWHAKARATGGNKRRRAGLALFPFPFAEREKSHPEVFTVRRSKTGVSRAHGRFSALARDKKRLRQRGGLKQRGGSGRGADQLGW